MSKLERKSPLFEAFPRFNLDAVESFAVCVETKTELKVDTMQVVDAASYDSSIRNWCLLRNILGSVEYFFVSAWEIFVLFFLFLYILELRLIGLVETLKCCKVSKLYNFFAKGIIIRIEKWRGIFFFRLDYRMVSKKIDSRMNNECAKTNF